MSQADYQIADQPGASFLAELNDHLLAIATQNSGPTAPATTYAGQIWWDTTANLIKIRNAANTAWGTVASWDGTTYIPYRAGTAIGTAAVKNTGTSGDAVPLLNTANTWSAAQALASGAALNESISTVASATTPDIWTGTSNVINYTGTATATGFAAAPQAGARRTLVLAGAAAFTAGSNVLIDGIASGGTWTGAAGDRVDVIALTTTQFRLSPRKADGTAVVSYTSPTANAGGTADAITATFTPAITALSNGLTVLVRAAAANTTTTPTFSPNGLTAAPIVKGNNLPLAVGDIAGAGHWLELQYDTTLAKWVLQNPATGVAVLKSATFSPASAVSAIEFTGLTGVSEIMFHLAYNGTAGGTGFPLIQLGNNTGYPTGVYSGSSTFLTTGVGTSGNANGVLINVASSGLLFSGAVSLRRTVNDYWVASGVIGRTDGAQTVTTGFRTQITAVDRIRLFSTTGTDTYTGVFGITWR